MAGFMTKREKMKGFARSNVARNNFTDNSSDKQEKENLNDSSELMFKSQSEITSSQSSTRSQFLSEISSQENSPLFKKPKLFNTKEKKPEDAYNVTFEESNTSITCSPQFKKSLFKVKKSSQAAFNVEEEESIREPDSTVVFPEKNLFNRKAPKKKHELNLNFTVSPVDSDKHLKQKDGSKHDLTDSASISGSPRFKKNLFKSKKKSESAFNVDHEESIQETDFSVALPERNQFNRKSSQRKNDSQLNFSDLPSEDVNSKNHDASEVKLEQPAEGGMIEDDLSDSNKASQQISSQESTDSQEVSISFNKPNPFGRKSRITSFDVSAEESRASIQDGVASNESIAESEKSGSLVARRDCSVPSMLDQSSFNDENLNQYMSDQSLNEISAIEPSLRSPSPMRASPQTANSVHIRAITPNDDEEFEQKLESELQLIIEKARKPLTRKSMVRDGDAAVKKTKIITVNNNRKFVKPKLRKPAPYANKRLYDYLIKKMDRKYGMDTVLRAEDIVVSICETVKIVCRRKEYQKKLVNDLKLEMAKSGIIETTFDFYEFVRNYLPESFRLKVIPCAQPVTNIIWPPKDAKSAFDPIL